MWCILLLGQMKTKSQVACKRRQIDAIADETSLPYTDGEAVSNPVGDIPITGIIVAIFPQGLYAGNWYHRCCNYYT